MQGAYHLQIDRKKGIEKDQIYKHFLIKNNGEKKKDHSFPYLSVSLL